MRARRSLGSSSDAIYRMVARALGSRGALGGRLVDVGCGRGGLWTVLSTHFDSYCGVDAVSYEGFPRGGEFVRADVDERSWPPIPAGDDVAAVETIEHLENPWQFVRQLVALVRPGGWVVVTTPNQLSALSVLTLLARRRFSAFQDAHFPVHRTALLPSDLVRAAVEAGLESVAVEFSLRGRLPLLDRHYPLRAARLFPCALSDNVMVIGRRPRG
jgi:hypothetical protein